MLYKVILVIVIVATVSTWITKVVHRRRMQHALGRKLKDSDLTSLKAWKEVLDAEEKGGEDAK